MLGDCCKGAGKGNIYGKKQHQGSQIITASGREVANNTVERRGHEKKLTKTLFISYHNVLLKMLYLIKEGCGERVG